MASTITRPALVGRMLAAAYPSGVPADQVENSVRITAVLNLVAESVATGRPFGGIPLTLLADASQPARFDEGAVEDVEDAADEPVPFVPVEAKPRSKFAHKNTDYDDLPVGILTDPMVGAVADVSANAVACHRVRFHVDAANKGGGNVDRAVLFRRLVQAWGAERCEAWLSRWPKAEELYGAEIRRAISGESPPKKTKTKPAPWTRPVAGSAANPKTQEPEPEPAKPAPVTPPLCAPVKRPEDVLANGTRRGARSLPRLAMPAPAAIPSSRQAELDAIEKAIAEGKVTRAPSRYVEPDSIPANPAGRRR